MNDCYLTTPEICGTFELDNVGDYWFDALFNHKYSKILIPLNINNVHWILLFISLSKNKEYDKIEINNQDDKLDNTLLNNQKNKLDYYSSKYKNYSTHLYVYDSFNNENPITLSRLLFFRRLCKVFHLNENNMCKISIHEQVNSVDCCYRIMYNIYMLGLHPHVNPLTDYYEDKKFKLFTELQCVLLNLCPPRLTNE